MDQFGSRLWWNWQLDTDFYHHWSEFRTFCEERGIKLLAYLNPYLANTGRNELFVEAQKQGLLLMQSSNSSSSSSSPLIQSSGSDNFTFGTVDLGSTKGRQWFVDQIMVKNLLQQGFSGWMSDFGEYIPLFDVAASPSRQVNDDDDDDDDDKVTNSSSKENGNNDDEDEDEDEHEDENSQIGLQLHNAFPGLWSATNAQLRTTVDHLLSIDNDNHNVTETTSDAKRLSLSHLSSGSDVLYFARSASVQSLSSASVFWAGDQLTSWDEFDGLQSCLRAYLSGGFSGMSLMSSDIGGYTMQRCVLMR